MNSHASLSNVRRQAGFRLGLTLIEIIVVVAIITVLVSLTAVMSRYLINQSNRRSTEIVLESLASATENYREVRGFYPWQEWTATWELELTRRAEPGGGARQPFFEAGPPVLRERALTGVPIFLPDQQGFVQIYDHFGQVQDINGSVAFVNRRLSWNPNNLNPGAIWPDTSNGNVPRGINMFGPETVLGRANQGQPVFVSAGPDSVFGNHDNDAYAFQGVNPAGRDDVFSHCGTDR